MRCLSTRLLQLLQREPSLLFCAVTAFRLYSIALSYHFSSCRVVVVRESTEPELPDPARSLTHACWLYLWLRRFGFVRASATITSHVSPHLANLHPRCQPSRPLSRSLSSSVLACPVTA